MKPMNIMNKLKESVNGDNKCVLCGKQIKGWGNDAWPLADGYCCDKCNDEKVIPARIAQAYRSNEDNLKESDDDGYTTYEVVIDYCGMGCDQEYNIYAKSKDDAVFHALDEDGSEAEQELEVLGIEDLGDGEYDVEVGFAGNIGVSNNYTVSASDEDEASMYALEEAKQDLEVVSVDGEEYTYGNDIYESKKPKKNKSLKESDTEEYWNAKELDRRAFVALLKFNNTDANGNKYIITNDANELCRFNAPSDKEAIEIFKTKKYTEPDFNKVNESATLVETEKWKNTEEDTYIELNSDGVVGSGTGKDVLDYGTFRGFDKRGKTIYIVMEYEGTLYVYSIDDGFPFTFKKESED